MAVGGKVGGPVLSIMDFITRDHVVRRGQRLPADHPAVKSCPTYFVPAPATTEAEAAAIHAGLVELSSAGEVLQQRPTRPIKPLVPDEDAVIAVRAVLHDKTWISFASRLSRKHPAVRRNPDAFVSVTGDVPRHRALVALDHMANLDAKTNATREIFAGQWVDQDDPFVQLHPLLFSKPDPELA